MNREVTVSFNTIKLGIFFLSRASAIGFQISTYYVLSILVIMFSAIPASVLMLVMLVLQCVHDVLLHLLQNCYFIL